jgi:hypothetical protein
MKVLSYVPRFGSLISYASNREAARRILKVRSKTTATLNPDGSISVDLSALNPEDRRAINQQELEEMLQMEFAPVESEETILDEQYVVGKDAELGKIHEILGRAQAAGRQEERVSILIDAILSDRSAGLGALIRYEHDRAKFANWALKELRSRFLEPPRRQMLLLDARSADEEIMAELIPQFFTHTFPMNRGSMLLILARSLGRWPLLNSAIRAATDRSQSFVVDMYRKEVHSELERRGANTEPVSPQTRAG